MDERQLFWMVYGDRQGAPTVKHWTRREAESEAERLATENPGIDFVVLRAVTGYRRNEPVTRLRFDRMEPPF